jgi:hypothetical protein
MAVGFGRRFRNNIMNWAFGKTPATTPAGVVYLSLHTTNPGDDGQGGGEPTFTNGYARVAMAAADWNALSNTPPPPANDAASAITNANNINFGPSSGGAFSSGATPLTYLGIWTASTGTTESLYIGRVQLTSGQVVNAAGITVTIAPAQLSVTGIST